MGVPHDPPAWGIVYQLAGLHFVALAILMLTRFTHGLAHLL